MSSQKKKNKLKNARLYKTALKHKGRRMKGWFFYTSAQRRSLKMVDEEK